MHHVDVPEIRLHLHVNYVMFIHVWHLTKFKQDILDDVNLTVLIVKMLQKVNIYWQKYFLSWHVYVACNMRTGCCRTCEQYFPPDDRSCVINASLNHNLITALWLPKCIDWIQLKAYVQFWWSIIIETTEFFYTNIK
jgi:hypothetical protein